MQRLHVYLQHTATTSLRANKQTAAFSKKKLLDVIDHLKQHHHQFPAKQTLQNNGSNYEDTILSNEYLQEKEKDHPELGGQTNARTVLDLGG